MKKIEEYIDESRTGRLRPANRNELKEIIRRRIREQGPNCDLNDIDVSGIKDMYNLFYDTINKNIVLCEIIG